MTILPRRLLCQFDFVRSCCLVTDIARSKVRFAGWNSQGSRIQRSRFATVTEEYVRRDTRFESRYLVRRGYFVQGECSLSLSLSLFHSPRSLLRFCDNYSIVRSPPVRCIVIVTSIAIAIVITVIVTTLLSATSARFSSWLRWNKETLCYVHMYRCDARSVLSIPRKNGYRDRGSTPTQTDPYNRNLAISFPVPHSRATTILFRRVTTSVSAPSSCPSVYPKIFRNSDRGSDWRPTYVYTFNARRGWFAHNSRGTESSREEGKLASGCGFDFGVGAYLESAETQYCACGSRSWTKLQGITGSPNSIGALAAQRNRLCRTRGKIVTLFFFLDFLLSPFSILSFGSHLTTLREPVSLWPTVSDSCKDCPFPRNWLGHSRTSGIRGLPWSWIISVEAAQSESWERTYRTLRSML